MQLQTSIKLLSSRIEDPNEMGMQDLQPEEGIHQDTNQTSINSVSPRIEDLLTMIELCQYLVWNCGPSTELVSPSICREIIGSSNPLVEWRPDINN
ncbi:unnamed protein product [Linum trigynum]|uniref:Uncharacterized protein n=1 Tax=Linum trigynum TaxID=586398 RepID=A0AAV2EC46_9ROSI